MPNYANSHMRNCLNPTFALSELDNYGYAREKSSCLSGFETILSPASTHRLLR